MATSLYAPRDTGRVISKNDIIIGAYSQLRISGITRSPSPEDLELALVRLEDMAAQWDLNMPVGYNFEDEPNPNSPSNVIPAFKQAFETGLAIRLIADFNKEPPATLLAMASGAMSAMASAVAMQQVRQVQYPSRMPVGSGNGQSGRWFNFYRSYGELPENSANATMYIGDKTTFVEHFDNYLAFGETIASFTIAADAGLNVSVSSNTTDDVLYTVEASSTTSAEGTNVLQLTIVATTSAGRVETRRRFIEVVPRS